MLRKENLQAIRFTRNEKTVGIAQLEDTHAISATEGKFLKADKPFSNWPNAIYIAETEFFNLT